MHSITALCRLTGLNASTLRSWERRYGTPRPSRAANGRRAYSQSKVDCLVVIGRLVREGHAIGDLCELTIDRLNALSSRLDATSSLEGRHAGAVQKLLDAVTAHDFSFYRQHAGHILGLIPAIDAIEDIFAPLLQRIESERAMGRTPTYVEHLVTSITKQLMLTATRAKLWPQSGNKILFATFKSDFNDIRLIMAWFATESIGYS